MTTTPPAGASRARMIALDFGRLPLEDTLARGRAFYEDMNRRRTTHHFYTLNAAAAGKFLASVSVTMVD